MSEHVGTDLSPRDEAAEPRDGQPHPRGTGRACATGTQPTERFQRNVTTEVNPGEAVSIRVRYFAGAKAASGVAQEDIRLPAGSTVHDVLVTLGSRHGDGLSRVLTASSFLVNGVAVRDRSVSLTNGIDLDVLPPFAGG